MEIVGIDWGRKKHYCSGYSTIVPEHSWMQDVLAPLGLAGYNQGLDLSCIPCLSYSNKQRRTGDCGPFLTE